MPDNEEEQQPQKTEDGGGGSGMLSGGKGWIIVVAVVVLEAVFFLVLMQLQAGQTVKGKGGGDDEITRATVEELTSYSVEIPKLHYSIPTQGGTTATLAMDLRIVLGRTAEERQQEETITPVDWKKFQSAVEQMRPYIKDRLIQYIGQQTYNQLNSPSGREKIKAVVKEYVNSELGKLDLQLDNKELDSNRVTQVLIPTFYLQ